MGDQANSFEVKAESETFNEEGGFSVRARFYAPPPQFDGCFTTFYQLFLDCPEDTTLEDYLQPEWSNIRFFATAAPRAQVGSSVVHHAPFTATGPSSLPCKFNLGSTRMWGIGFLPLGWSRFIEADAAELSNFVTDGSTHPAFEKFDCLTDVLCDPTVSSEDQLLHIAETLARLMKPSRDEAKIVRVHRAIVGGQHHSVGDLADTCGMSIRTLERVCRRYFGFTPKRLMRRQRFMRSLSTYMLQRGSRWTEAMDAEYHDQAQFTREFREFMTMNPSEYAALPHPILAAFMEARERVWGSAAQTLDQPPR